MKCEELKELGLTDTQIEKIMAVNGQDLNQQKAMAEAERAKAAEVKAQLDQLAQNLAQTQKSAGDADVLKAQLAKAQNDLSDMRKAGKLREALAEYKPRDAEVLLKLIDSGRISIAESGEVVGLKDQIEPLRKSSGYLFADTPTDRGGAPAAGAGTDGFNMNEFLRGN